MSPVLGFIKFAFARTGTANDINSLLIILIIVLILVLAIPYLLSKLRTYILDSLHSRNKLNKNIPNESKDDINYF